MKLAERRCEVDGCGHLADGPPSAHFARVVFLCTEHSAKFHSDGGLAELLHLQARQLSTREVLGWIHHWLKRSELRGEALQVLRAGRRLQA